jgi:hypothetical protein
MKKKVNFPLAITFVVLCGVLLVVVILQYGLIPGIKIFSGQPSDQITEDETPNWRIYRNEEYGFEIKHPEDWQLKIADWLDPEDREKLYVELYPPEAYLPDLDVRDPIIVLGVIEGIEGASFPIKFLGRHGESLICEDIQIGNFSFCKLTIDRSDGSSFTNMTIYAIEKKSLIYSVTMACGWSDCESRLEFEVFEKMVSTFRFIDTEEKKTQGWELLEGSLALEKEEPPADLKVILFEPCKSGSEDHEFAYNSVDLNDDGIKEFIVSPLVFCGESIIGATGNGPIWIYQKLDGGWEAIEGLVMEGNTIVVKEEKTNGYHDLVTYWHLSAVSGIITLYRWDESSSSYSAESSIEVGP